MSGINTFGPFTRTSSLIATISGIVDGGTPPAPDTFKSPPVWSSSDPTVLAVGAPSADGLTLTTFTLLKAGAVTLTAVGDGISRSVTVTIVDAGVADFMITVALAPPPPPPGA